MNNCSKKYKYVERNLLEQPEKYFFSEYGGKALVEDYFRSRIEIIESIENETSPNEYKQFYDYLNGYIVKYDSFNNEKVYSLDVLRNIIISIKQNTFKSEVDKKYLDLFLKQYEIKKKIFEVYDNKFKPIGKECHNIEPYCLLSISCLLYYKQTKNLKYMNTSIKINDMLCSKNIILKKEIYFLMYVILIEEIECVKELFIKEDIHFDFI